MKTVDATGGRTPIMMALHLRTGGQPSPGEPKTGRHDRLMTVEEKAKRCKVQKHEWYLRRKAEIEELKIERERRLEDETPI